MGGHLILFIVTSNGFLGNSTHPTGWYVPEVAHPYNVISQANNGIVIGSPLGGPTPYDPASLSQNDPACDQECLDFVKNVAAMGALNNSLPLSKINPDDYDAVFFPGGHGPMFDLGNNVDAHRIARKMFEDGKIVAAVCHGPVGIVNMKLSNGEYFVKGRNVTGFTNAEEDEVKMTAHMPFLLEDAVKKNGGNFFGGPNWAENVIQDGKLITGQNPLSARLVAKKIVEALP